MPVGNNICNQQGSAKIIMVCNSQPKESFLYNSIRHKYFRKMRWMEWRNDTYSFFVSLQTFWEQMTNWKNSSELNNNKNMILSVTEVWDCVFSFLQRKDLCSGSNRLEVNASKRTLRRSELALLGKLHCFVSSVKK